MSALEDLKLKANKDYTSLEAAIVYLSGTYYADAENAAAELERMTAVIEAARKLVEKMEHVYETTEYQAVWFSAQIHIGEYTGETWGKEVEAAKVALAELDGAK